MEIDEHEKPTNFDNIFFQNMFRAMFEGEFEIEELAFVRTTFLSKPPNYKVIYFTFLQIRAQRRAMVYSNLKIVKLEDVKFIAFQSEHG